MTLDDEIDKVKFVQKIGDIGYIVKHRNILCRLTLCEGTGEYDAFFKYFEKGPEIFLDDDIPREYWETIIAHEFAELIYESQSFGDSESKRNAHEYAMNCERIYLNKYTNKKTKYKFNSWRKSLSKQVHPEAN